MIENLLESIASNYEGIFPMSKPLNINGFTYATNGHLMLRVKAIEKYDDNKVTDKEIQIFTSLNIDKDDHDWQDIPKYKSPDKVNCYRCGGVGKVDTCYECDGDGEITHDTGYNEYEWSCMSCHGSGVVAGKGEDCHYCHGSGKTYSDSHPHIDFLKGQGARVSMEILDMIKDLPRVKITLKQNEKGMLALKWNGGRGCFMMMTR